jgi:hypothetical protein
VNDHIHTYVFTYVFGAADEDNVHGDKLLACASISVIATKVCISPGGHGFHGTGWFDKTSTCRSKSGVMTIMAVAAEGALASNSYRGPSQTTQQMRARRCRHKHRCFICLCACCAE